MPNAFENNNLKKTESKYELSFDRLKYDEKKHERSGNVINSPSNFFLINDASTKFLVQTDRLFLLNEPNFP